MEIETYESTEVATLTDEEREEFTRIAGELGLSKQQNLITGKGVNPFPVMTRAQRNVYRELLPDTSSVEQFEAEAIPLRVLRLIKMVREEGWFETLLIWFSPHEKDPVLVGHAKSDWNSPPHLLARWGDVLLDMPTLTSMAVEHMRKRERARLEAELASVDYTAVTHMMGH